MVDHDDSIIIVAIVAYVEVWRVFVSSADVMFDKYFKVLEFTKDDMANRLRNGVSQASSYYE